MTPPGMARAGLSRDRPRGYFPRGTSLGLVGLAALAVGVPFSVLECAAPLTRGGFDRWLGSIPYVLGFGLLPTFIFILGARSHRYWTICFFFYTGAALLFAYVSASILALAALAGFLPVRDPALAVMNIVAIIMLLILAPFAWFLLRALRLRYWQPGSPPGMWEAGDETPPAWTLSPRQRNGN